MQRLILPLVPQIIGAIVLYSSKFSETFINPKSSEFERHLQFDANQVQFGGDSDLTDDVKALQTPFKVWCHLLTQSFEEEIVMETLRYDGVHQSFNFTVPDLRKFIGILFYITYYKLPNSRDYWSANKHRVIQIIQSLQIIDAYFLPKCLWDALKNREFLHFNDKSKMPDRNDTNSDRLYLIRPIIDTLPYRNHKNQKLYKPKKWGLKLYVIQWDSPTKLSGAIELADGEPDLQSSANIVVRLIRGVPQYQNFVIYFDNITVPLIVYLRTQGILAVGTIRRNRIKNCKLPEEKIMIVRITLLSITDRFL